MISAVTARMVAAMPGKPFAIALAVLLLLALPASGSARPGADLVVSAVGRPPATAVPGSSFDATARVRNAGGRRAAGSVVRFALSRDAKLGKGDLTLAARKLKKLQPRTRARASRSLRVPLTASGAYRLIACADARKRVKERNERNNCRAAAGTVTVGAGTGGPPAQGGPPPVGQGPAGPAAARTS